MKGRGHLGKGLGALIPEANDSAENNSGGVEAIREIDVALIDPNPFQPRLTFDPEMLEDLKKSIKENGVIQPILVRPGNEGRYELVAGERRMRATLDLGLKMIPAYIKEINTDEEMLEIALIENVQREHLNPIEQGKGYQRLIDDCNLTQEDVARKIGKDRTTVANVIRLLKLPEKIQTSLGAGEIREGHARALLRISDKQVQERAWRRAVKESLSVRTVEQIARKYQEKKDGPPAPRAAQRRKSAYIGKVEGRLREKLGTQVKVRTKKEGGSIEVVFYSSEDLERLLDIFDKIRF